MDSDHKAEGPHKKRRKNGMKSEAQWEEEEGKEEMRDNNNSQKAFTVSGH